jgi:hypothetical protein
MALHVCFGGSGEYERLPLYAASGDEPLWTLPSAAQAGDTVVFYMKSPLAAFVANGLVRDNLRQDGTPSGFPGQMMGKVARASAKSHFSRSRLA